ncbi:MAG TPA: nucleoside 2-deoxyribosyltransferase [Spirochaetales bacterium]|nr:nucleoside 2-deoxyribosyltransferase [Spirochaetales bacterium]
MLDNKSDDRLNPEGRSMRFYFAAPLFCDAERRYNADLAGKVEALGYDVFLPQRDGVVGDSETGGDAGRYDACDGVVGDSETGGDADRYDTCDGGATDRDNACDGGAVMRRAKAIFELDLARIEATDIFFYLLDGRVPDEGAAVALGIAYADKAARRPDRLLLGLHTDGRSAFPDAALNPMLAAALDRVFTDERSLLAYLEGLPRR